MKSFGKQTVVKGGPPPPPNYSLIFSIGACALLRQLTELEHICHRQEPIRHGLLLIYVSQIRPETGFIPGFLSKWESDLETRFTDLQKKSLHFAQKFSMATRIQETSYKVLTRWYRVPTVYTAFFPGP